jgi:hypothetical protein
MLRRTLLAGLAVMGLAVTAQAGPVYLAMVLDPATTAGASVPAINRANSTGTFTVTSNKSGAGSFHIFALDDTTGSFGLSFFKVALTGGAVTNVLNRSPIGSFDTLDDAAESQAGGAGAAGFSDTLVRSGQGLNGPLPLQGAQGTASPYRIGGLGQTASNFNNTPNMLAVPSGGTRPWAGVTSGQWGDYATDPTTGTTGKNWIFLGEGNYTPGAAPAIDGGASTTILYYSAADFNFQNTGQVVVGTPPIIPEPATFALVGLASVAGLGFRRRRA